MFIILYEDLMAIFSNLNVSEESSFYSQCCLMHDMVCLREDSEDGSLRICLFEATEIKKCIFIFRLRVISAINVFKIEKYLLHIFHLIGKGSCLYRHDLLLLHDKNSQKFGLPISILRPR